MIFPGLEEHSGVWDALRINPPTANLLSQLHQELMRGPSQFSEGQRELVAAYVSGLNHCDYCRETHGAAANCFRPRLVIRNGDIEEEMIPVLAFARKLTLDHRNITSEDLEAVTEHWSPLALHQLILVVCAFNFMNRFVHGHGISAAPDLCAERGKQLCAGGYLPPAAGPDPSPGPA